MKVSAHDGTAPNPTEHDQRLHIAIGIATRGRPDVLADTVDVISQQTRRADQLIICPTTSADIDLGRAQAYGHGLLFVEGAQGSCHQRNAIINAAGNADLLVFLDDDFLIAPDFIAQVERLFLREQDVVVATGAVLADGIRGHGISFREGMCIIASSTANAFAQSVDVYNGYGCNMVVRMSPIRDWTLRFDENLPLYAWQEDVDFSRQLARFGRITRSDGLRGVHLGSKRGRSSGKSLGYSQVANPIYLVRKGTVSCRHSLGQITRNILSNVLRSIKPEPWIDRRGRMHGNLLACQDLILGRLSPTRILDF